MRNSTLTAQSLLSAVQFPATAETIRSVADARLAAEAARAIDAYWATFEKLKTIQDEADAATKSADPRYREGHRALYAASKRWDTLGLLANSEWNRAQERVLALILACAYDDDPEERIDVYRPANKHWHGRALVHGEYAYVAIPLDGQEDPGEHQDGETAKSGWATGVLAVPLARIVELVGAAEVDGEQPTDDKEPDDTDPDDPRGELCVYQRGTLVRYGEGQTLAELLTEHAEHFDADATVWLNHRLVGMARRRDDGAIETVDYTTGDEDSTSPAHELRSRTMQRRAYVVTRGDVTISTSSPGQSLDDLVAELTDDIGSGPQYDESEDVAVWDQHGALLAVVKMEPGNVVGVHRFDAVVGVAREADDDEPDDAE